MTYSLTGKRIWVAGHNGMVGSALCRRLSREPCTVLTVGRAEIDLRRQADVERWMTENRPDAIMIAAAKVGGIMANDALPADFLYENLMIEANILHTAKLLGVEKVLLLGSSCIYPKFAEQPIREDSLLTAPLEPSNEWYALAKIAGVKMCEAYRRQYGCDFISAMPTNLYGPGDNFDLAASHVIPALMRKIDAAKTQRLEAVTIWGTGTPLREFLHVDDLADACVFLMRHYDEPQTINVGSGEEVSISALAHLLAEIVGYRGAFAFDTAKLDGTPRKLLDVGRLTALGWQATTRLRPGLEAVYRWYGENAARLRA